MASYIGEWKFGHFDGRGKVTTFNGNIYVGEFRKGYAEGRGTKSYPDGSKYVGDFKNGQYNGYGTRTDASGLKYVGEFINGQFYGQGTLSFEDGRILVGEFRNNQLVSGGTLKFPDGRTYVGQFKANRASGQGTLAFPDRSKYVGEFGDNKRNGKGTLFNPDNTIKLSGTWIDDMYIGSVEGQESVAMEQEGGVYTVPIQINGAITLNAIIDSGASDVTVPADVVSTLTRTKTVAAEDFLGSERYTLADGSLVSSQRFRIRTLKIGNQTLEGVTGSVSSARGPILLGQSFLKSFKSWSIDNERHVLILK